MIKVTDIFPIGDMLSVTLEGMCENITNGSKLIDSSGNEIVVISVAMTRYEDPSDINKMTAVMINNCQLKKGTELSIA